jgi:hypothetical protein
MMLAGPLFAEPKLQRFNIIDYVKVMFEECITLELTVDMCKIAINSLVLGGDHGLKMCWKSIGFHAYRQNQYGTVLVVERKPIGSNSNS